VLLGDYVVQKRAGWHRIAIEPIAATLAG